MTRTISARVFAVSTILLLLVFAGMLPAPLHGQARIGPPPGLIILPPGILVQDGIPSDIIDEDDTLRPAERITPVTNAARRGDQLQHLLVVRLVNALTFRVVSSIAVDAALQTIEALPDQLGDPDVLAAVADLTGADYALTSSVTVVGDAGTWTIDLRQTGTAQSVWSTIVPVDPDNPIAAVRTAAEALSQFGREVRMVQREDIALLLEAGEITAAARLVERYRETRPDTPEIVRLAAEVRAAHVNELLATAVELSDLWLFDEALVAVNRALARDPESAAAQQVLTDIRLAQEEAEHAAIAERLTMAQQLVAEGYHASASLLVDTIEEAVGDETLDGELAALRDVIRRESRAESRYTNALAAYWRADYHEARTEVTQAIVAAPDRTEYGQLLDAIDRADRRRTSGAAVVQGYRTRLAAWDVTRALSGPVAVLPSWEVALGTGTVADRDQATLGERRIRQTVVHTTFRRPYLLPIGTSGDALSLYGGWFAGGELRGGAEESSRSSGLDDGTQILERKNRWHLGPTGGGFAMARVFGFTVEMALEIASPVLLQVDLDRDPTTDRDERATAVAWAPTVGVSGALSWRWNERAYMTIRYRQSLVGGVIPAADAGREQYTTRDLSIGYGWSVP